ncbi:MAG TPA: hypothetical protein VJ962_13500 [Clostridia bacterium]|nr:hypothetical protein [Clostridia bacterium]
MKLVDVLLELASRFNEKSITWAVGGSLLLYFYDILEEPKDIDIIIAPEDKETVFRILKTIGKELETKEVSNYKTGVFGKFNVDGIEVDIIGDFYISVSDGYYLHPFSSKNLKVVKRNNETIYLDSLENWLKTYEAMGDPKKRVELIKQFLEE